MIRKATENLKTDGCELDVYCDGVVIFSEKSVINEPTTALGKALQTVKNLMENCNHALYKGDIYRKSTKGNTSVKVFSELILFQIII